MKNGCVSNRKRIMASTSSRPAFRGVSIVFCIVAVIIGALGFIIMAMPYLLGIFVIYCIYSIVSSLLHR